MKILNNPISISYSNSYINSYKLKKINNHTNQNVVKIHKRPKKGIINIQNKITFKKSYSSERKYNINNNKLINNIFNFTNSKSKSNAFSENVSDNKSIKGFITDNNKIKFSEIHQKPKLFLDLIQNNLINQKNNNNNHIVSNTDTNLNNLIKVNIKLNKEKENNLLNNMIMKRKIVKICDNIASEQKPNIFKYKPNLQNFKIINKIIFIQTWWKKYFFIQAIHKKAKNFLNSIKKIIYKNIMKYFIRNLYNIKYYFFKWYQYVYLKIIINKIIICRQKQFINKTLNTKKNFNTIHIKNQNFTSRKKQKNLKRMKKIGNFITFKKKIQNQNKMTFSTNMSSIVDSLLNNNSINNYSNVYIKSPINPSLSSKNNTMLSHRQSSFGKNVNKNKIFSTLNKKKKNKNKERKLTFNTIDKNHLNINNSAKTQFNKEINTFNNNINNNRPKKRIKKVYSNNINNTNKFLISYRDKTSKLELNFKNENNKLFKNLNNKNHIRNTKNNYFNKNLKQKFGLYINDTENSDNNIVNSTKLLKTEPNNINNSANNANFLSAINYSKKKNKANKNRYTRLKKFDTCPLSFKSKKFNLYQQFFIKKCFCSWKEISLKNKIISIFFKLSKIAKLRLIFNKARIIEIKRIMNFLLLKKYFAKYKDIIWRKTILKKLKINNIDIKSTKYLKHFSNKNVKRGGIINNININNYINYTNNDLDNFIPKSTKNYDIISKSMKINNNNATLFKTPFNYFNNFNNLEELNIFNTNINFELNKNLNSDKNYQTIILEEKKGKKPEGILVNQINQICMVFNLIEQHYRNNKPSLFNCFIKWKKNVLKKTNYNNNINNCNLNEKKKINEKIINFKKIAIKNKNKNNHNLEINNIIKSQIKNNNYSLQPKDELKYNYEKINNNENIYSEKKTIKYNDFEFNNYNNILKNNNNKTIKYIELNRHTLDNYYESTLFKNNFNSEIVYQKKILNYNHIPNSNNFNNFPNNNIISDNKYSFKKINKIEEREVHFNSLSTNKNKSYNQINNNVIYNNIFQYNKKRNLEEMNNENFLEKELKNKISKIRINMPNPKDKNKLNFDHNEKKISNQNLINEIKTIFSKNNKVETKKVNQTFCGFPLNYQDELV